MVVTSLAKIGLTSICCKKRSYDGMNYGGKTEVKYLMGTATPLKDFEIGFWMQIDGILQFGVICISVPYVIE